MKFAAYNGNDHCKVRVTTFFDTRAEAADAAKAAGHLTAFVAPCANWKEHMKWNIERVGNYASCPVDESLFKGIDSDGFATYDLSFSL